jgi:hypothetical protein
MSSIYLKSQFENLAMALESDRIERVLTNRGSTWDYRHALNLVFLNVLKVPIANAVLWHFRMLTEYSRTIVYISLINLDAQESEFSKIEMKLQNIQHSHG